MPLWLRRFTYRKIQEFYENKNLIELDVTNNKTHFTPEDIAKQIKILRKEMLKAAELLSFEKASAARDKIEQLEQLLKIV